MHNFAYIRQKNSKITIFLSFLVFIYALYAFERLLDDVREVLRFQCMHFVCNIVRSIGRQHRTGSLEDNGAGICFNVFVYNVQDGIEIDYATGDSKLVKQPESETPAPTPTPEPETDSEKPTGGEKKYAVNTARSTTI